MQLIHNSAELLNRNSTAGSYTVEFDTASLSRGVNIYQVKAGTFTQVKKMNLIK